MVRTSNINWTRAFAAALVAVCVSLAALAPTAFADEAASQAEAESYAPGEFIVVYEPGVVAPAAASSNAAPSGLGALAADGVEEVEPVADSLGDLGAVVKVTATTDEEAETLMEDLEASDKVAFVQRNFRYYLMDDMPTSAQDADVLSLGAQPTPRYSPSYTTNDPYDFRQYYLNEWGNAEGSGANVRTAWESAKTNGSVTVAVLDTGVRPTHEDLKGNILSDLVWDSFNQSAPGTITDKVGHGTHVCGIVSATADNELGIAGASYNAKLLPIKVFNDEEKSTLIFGEDGSYAETEWIIRAYNYLFELMDNKTLTDLHVINMSLGGYDPLKAEDAVLEAAIQTMRDDYAVLTVCAGGNGDLAGDPQTIASYPSDFEPCLSVTALQENGTNVKWSDYNAAKDISAPGVALYSTYFNNNSSYRSMSGTSMASPLVAGIAALLWSVEPDLSVDQVVEAIQATAIPLDPAGANYHAATETGSPGAIDAAAAVDYVFDHFSDDTRINIRDAEVAPIDFEYYTGAQLTPSVTVTYNGVALEEGVDYELSYSDNVEVGKGRVTVAGIGRFRGAKPVRFDICYDLADNNCFRAQALGTRLYTGEPVCPTPRVFYNDVALVMGADFTVTYEDNIKGRPATCIIEGIGNYRGTQTLYFNIKGAPADPEPLPVLAIASGAAPLWTQGQPANFSVTVSGLAEGETVNSWVWEYANDGADWKRTGAAYAAEGATCTLAIPSCTEARKPPMAWRCTATTSLERSVTSEGQSMAVLEDFALVAGKAPYWVAGKPVQISVAAKGLFGDEVVTGWSWEYSRDGKTWRRTGSAFSADGTSCTLAIPECTEARKPPMAWRAIATTSTGRTAASEPQSLLVPGPLTVASAGPVAWVKGASATIVAVADGFAEGEEIASAAWYYSNNGRTWKKTGTIQSVDGVRCAITVPECTDARKPPMAWRVVVTTNTGRTATSEGISLSI